MLMRLLSLPSDYGLQAKSMTRLKYQKDQKGFFNFRVKKKEHYPFFILFWSEAIAGQFILAVSLCSNWCMKPVRVIKLGLGHFWLPPAWGHTALADYTKVPSFSNLPQNISHTAKRHCFAWQECNLSMLQIQILFILSVHLAMCESDNIIKMFTVLLQGNEGTWPHRSSGRPWIQSKVEFAVPENQLILTITGIELLLITVLLQIKTLIFVGNSFCPRLLFKRGQRLLASRSYFLCNFLIRDAHWRFLFCITTLRRSIITSFYCYYYNCYNFWVFFVMWLSLMVINLKCIIKFKINFFFIEFQGILTKGNHMETWYIILHKLG